MGPLSGWLSDRFGARPFSTLGLLLQALGFFLLAVLPLNFDYPWFALIIFFCVSLWANGA
jgi:MFS family permease